jgi:hypothetical protein
MRDFEILVRNAIDTELGHGQPDAPLTRTWLMDFDVLRPDGVKQVIVAVEQLERRKPMTRGRVIASLSFGFWSGLFGPRYEELWRHRLRHAFPHAKERTELSAPVDALRWVPQAPRAPRLDPPPARRGPPLRDAPNRRSHRPGRRGLASG